MQPVGIYKDCFLKLAVKAVFKTSALTFQFDASTDFSTLPLNGLDLLTTRVIYRIKTEI